MPNYPQLFNDDGTPKIVKRPLGPKPLYGKRMPDRMINIADRHAETLAALGVSARHPKGNVSAGARLAAELVALMGITPEIAAKIIERGTAKPTEAWLR